MKRIAFVGQPHWVRHLARLIDRHGGSTASAASVCVPGRLGPHEVRALLASDVLVRVGFRPNARTVRGIGFDLAWRVVRGLNPHAAAFCYWIGTDVLNALDEGKMRSRTLTDRLRRDDGLRHMAGAPWLAEELRSIGVRAVPALFPGDLPSVQEPERLPAEFRVLTYIPDARPQLYSADAIRELATRCPAVGIDVLGGTGSWCTGHPSNLVFHGWQGDLAPFYDRCSVVVRAVAHDAFGGSVRDGLAWARHVIYTYAVPHTRHVPYGDVDALVDAIDELHREHREGTLRPNHAGRQFALASLNGGTLTRDLLSLLTE